LDRPKEVDKYVEGTDVGNAVQHRVAKLLGVTEGRARVLVKELKTRGKVLT